MLLASQKVKVSSTTALDLPMIFVDFEGEGNQASVDMKTAIFIIYGKDVPASEGHTYITQVIERVHGKQTLPVHSIRAHLIKGKAEVSLGAGGAHVEIQNAKIVLKW